VRDLLHALKYYWQMPYRVFYYKFAVFM